MSEPDTGASAFIRNIRAADIEAQKRKKVEAEIHAVFTGEPAPEQQADTAVESPVEDRPLRPFLVPEQETILTHSIPGEGIDDSVSLQNPDLAQILRAAGISLQIKIPERMRPYITDSDPRIIGEE